MSVPVDIKSQIEKSLYQPSSEILDIPSDFEIIKKNGMSMIVNISITGKNAVILFPPNRGNITHNVKTMRKLSAKYPDSDIWSFDYPGFGDTPGFPTTESIISMGYYVVSHIQKKYKESIWIGDSIGSSVLWGVLHMGTNGDRPKISYIPKSIIMINPIKSVSSMATLHHKHLNPAPLIKKFGYELDTEYWIRECKKVIKVLPSVTIYRSNESPEIPVEQTRDIANLLEIFITYIEGNLKEYVI